MVVQQKPINKTASYEGKVEYTYQWIKKNSNWLPVDADSEYDRRVVQSLLAMMGVQHASDWKVVRAIESDQPFDYSKRNRFSGNGILKGKAK
jgi:hypothetical protein